MQPYFSYSISLDFHLHLFFILIHTFISSTPPPTSFFSSSLYPNVFTNFFVTVFFLAHGHPSLFTPLASFPSLYTALPPPPFSPINPSSAFSYRLALWVVVDLSCLFIQTFSKHAPKPRLALQQSSSPSNQWTIIPQNICLTCVPDMDSLFYSVLIYSLFSQIFRV